MIPKATAYRTHTCGELRGGHAGQEVKLAGAVDRHNEDGSFDLRDSYGKTRVKLGPKPAQMIIDLFNFPETPPEKRFTKLTQESVVSLSGTVKKRDQADEKLPTGEIWLDVTGMEILAPAKPQLIFDPNDEKVSAADKRRHRYVSLRKPSIHEHLRFRTRMAGDLRRFLAERGFIDVQTPLLAQRWTPDQTDAFLSVRSRADVFALQGSKSIVGEVLMASGFDRTFEVGRRFQRKAAYGPLEQPEFTVLEANMAWVEESDLISTAVQLIANIGKSTLGEPFGVIPKITWADAHAKYGTDLPDLRFPIEVQDLAKAGPANAAVLVELMKHGTVRYIRVGAARAGSKLTGDLGLEKMAAEIGKPGFAQRIVVTPEKTADLGGDAGMSQEAADELVASARGEPQDVIFALGGKNVAAVSSAAGRLRLGIGAATGPARKHAFALVTRPPYFQYDTTLQRSVLREDPLARPVPGEIEGDEKEMRALSFAVVLNGVKVGTGSVRNFDPGVQNELFAKLGLKPQESSDRYGPLLDAFRFGVPPHGKLVLGIDRLAALLRGLESLDDVMAMPKNPDGTDGLARSPSPLTRGFVRGLLGH